MRTIADHILDILQNSIKANADKIEFSIVEDTDNNNYIVNIDDNGCGMSKEMIGKVASPFFTTRTTRKVGLGISLLKQNAELTGGSFNISSEEGRGTIVEAIFKLNNIDRKPLGDIADVFYLTMLSQSNIDIIYHHTTAAGSFSFSSQEIRDELDGVPLQNRVIRGAIINLIKNNLKEIKAFN